MHPQSLFLPIPDHDIVRALVKLIDNCAQNRRLRTSPKPPLDRRRLVTDLQLRQEMDTTIGRHLRANPLRNSNVDDVKLHSPQPSCEPLTWYFHPRNEGDQGEV